MLTSKTISAMVIVVVEVAIIRNRQTNLAPSDWKPYRQNSQTNRLQYDFQRNSHLFDLTLNAFQSSSSSSSLLLFHGVEVRTTKS